MFFLKALKFYVVIGVTVYVGVDLWILKRVFYHYCSNKYKTFGMKLRPKISGDGTVKFQTNYKLYISS